MRNGLWMLTWSFRQSLLTCSTHEALFFGHNVLKKLSCCSCGGEVDTFMWGLQWRCDFQKENLNSVHLSVKTKNIWLSSRVGLVSFTILSCLNFQKTFCLWRKSNKDKIDSVFIALVPGCLLVPVTRRIKHFLLEDIGKGTHMSPFDSSRWPSPLRMWTGVTFDLPSDIGPRRTVSNGPLYQSLFSREKLSRVPALDDFRTWMSFTVMSWLLAYFLHLNWPLKNTTERISGGFLFYFPLEWTDCAPAPCSSFSCLSSLLFKDFIFTLFLCVSGVGLWIWVQCQWRQKKTSDTLELEVYTVVSCPMWALWTELRSLVEALNCEPSFQPSCSLTHLIPVYQESDWNTADHLENCLLVLLEWRTWTLFVVAGGPWLLELRWSSLRHWCNVDLDTKPRGVNLFSHLPFPLLKELFTDYWDWSHHIG